MTVAQGIEFTSHIDPSLPSKSVGGVLVAPLGKPSKPMRDERATYRAVIVRWSHGDLAVVRGFHSEGAAAPGDFAYNRTLGLRIVEWVKPFKVAGTIG
jgi:hypothetical protein